jgi:succinate dehydrogenase / fumarate reductase, iron-sulfur subunit
VNLTLKVWRQKSPRDSGPRDNGRMVTYQAPGISPDMSFLEMLDIVNAKLELAGEEPIAFDHDCREGICGTCSLMINGIAHGPDSGTTACQLHMRRFSDGDTIYIEPWRARAFPVLKDLVVDRSAFDRIMQAGGFISVNTGGTPDANSLPVSKEEAELSMDAAACIGCGACVASCKNASAMLFVSAKVAQFAHLPQGQPERYARVQQMIATMDREGFGNCTNQGECEAVCPKEIKMTNIALMNRDFLVGVATSGARGAADRA